MTVKEFLHEYDIKPSWLSEHTGISKEMIGHYRAGTKKPGIKAVNRIKMAINKLAYELKNVSICERI